MKKLLTSSILLLSFAFYFSGCSDDDEPAPSGGTTTPSYKFLAVGHTLSYNVQSPFGTDTVINVVLSDAGGGVFMATQSSLPTNEYGYESYLKNCSGNLAWGEFSNVDCANIYMKGNRNVGDIYTYDEGGGDSATHVVIAKNVSVTVPAGTFTCDKLTYSNGSVVDTFYVNNDYFQIKYDGIFVTYQLKSKNF